MSFGGTVLAMIQSLRHNALRKRKTIFTREEGPKTNLKVHPNHLKPASPESLEEAVEWTNRRKKRDRLATIAGVVCSVVVLYLPYLLMEYVVVE